MASELERPLEERVGSYRLHGYVLAPLHHDMSVNAVRTYLLSEGKPIIYGLEPGDGTSYKMLLCPVTETSEQKGLYITRLYNRDPNGTTIIWDWNTGASEFAIREAAAALNSKDHPHTTRIMLWFLAHLCEHFNRR